MSESHSSAGDTLLVLLLGAAAGAAAGLLLAPRTGRETRRRVRRWMADVEEGLREEGLDEVWEKGKEAVRATAEEMKGRVESAVREKAGAVKDKVESVIKEAWQGREQR